MTATLTRTLGKFVWREVFTRDTEAAKRFYSQLFGWTWEDRPMGEDFVYTLFKNGDAQICGMMNLDELPGDSSQIPPHWASYVSVESVDETVETAVAEGATVLSECHDIPEVGRFAVMQDPQGAVFHLMHFFKGDGEDTPPGLHDFCWENLTTHEPARAKAFYEKVIGWGTEPMGEGTTVFTRLKNGEPCGLASMGPAGDGHPAWTPFVNVASIVETTAKVRALGGQVFVERTEIPEVGAFGVIQDPTGAVLFLFEGRSC